MITPRPEDPKGSGDRNESKIVTVWVVSSEFSQDDAFPKVRKTSLENLFLENLLNRTTFLVNDIFDVPGWFASSCQPRISSNLSILIFL